MRVDDADEGVGEIGPPAPLPGVRVLLLSATPYKMYAVGEDQSTGTTLNSPAGSGGFFSRLKDRFSDL